MNRTIRILSLALVAALLGLHPGGGALSAQPQESEITLDLRAEIHRAHLLEPGSPVVTDQLVLDSADSVRWLFGSASKTLDVVLTAPDGSTVALSDPETATQRGVVYPDPSDPTTSGANYLFVLEDPQPGTWSYRVEETAPLSATRAVVLDVFSTSPVRVGLLGGGEDYRVDRPVNLALVAADGPDLLADVNIGATVRGIDGNSFPETALAFADDGAGPDVNSGDGMYTAGFLPGAAGGYQVVATLTGTRSDGDAFERTATATFRILPVQATLSGAFADRGIDLDGDQLLDRIGVAPSLDVLVAGEYNVAVTLESSNGGVLRSHLLDTFPAGVANPEVIFAADDVKQLLAADGPYQVSEVRVEATGGDEEPTVDAAYHLGDTAPYALTDLQRRAILLAGGGSANGVDTNGNGQYEYLDVQLGVDLLTSGFYRWSARLVDAAANEIALDGGAASFGTGAGTLTLRFDGTAIGANGADGPYFVRNLIVFGSGESLIVDDPFTTQAFLASDFEGYVADSEPPQLSVTATPSVLWPPNHELVAIQVDIQVSDDVDPNPEVSLVSVTSNEGDDLIGDGHTTNDIQVGAGGEIHLRAERSGTGTGRVYTLTYSAVDDAGNRAEATTQVVVPLSQGNGKNN